MARQKKNAHKAVPVRKPVKPHDPNVADGTAPSPPDVSRELARRVFDQVSATRGRRATDASKRAPARPPPTQRNAGRRKS